MQKIQQFFVFALFLGAFLFSSCDDKSSNNPNASTPAAGNWKVAYFFDKQDETGNYDAYVFEFAGNGSLSAVKNGQSWNGAWSTGVDDSKDKFVISFSPGAPSALSELAEDWLIIKMDDNVMQFEHTSGGNGDTDVLHFEHL